jgi:hypothetical protein
VDTIFFASSENQHINDISQANWWTLFLKIKFQGEICLFMGGCFYVYRIKVKGSG